MIELETQICRDFEASSSREWLETNGIGGYASSSISGAGTRRYHGLLVAATKPPLGRQVLLSRFDEAVIVGDERFEISCNQYPGSAHPQGYRYMRSFKLDPYPRWTYEIAGIELERSIFMAHGENTTVCRWAIKKGDPAAVYGLELRPLVAFRDHHHLRQSSDWRTSELRIEPASAAFRPDGDSATLHFAHNAAETLEMGVWYRNFAYAIERERGFEYHEDLYQPFMLSFDLARDAIVVASTEECPVSRAEDLEKEEMKRRADLVVRSEIKDERLWPLVLAADQFVVDRGKGKTVIAGYHWFSDWGRDTMIALPGLALAANRPEIARSILLEYSRHISEGMIPNRFPDEGETPDYNTVDATLWYFEAVRAYLEKTADEAFVRDELFEKLADIIDWHVRGTRFGIRVDADALLTAGGAGHQLTWMDAKVGDWVVTPRDGKPVEIQALWYNALCIMAEFAGRFGGVERASQYKGISALVRSNFNAKFWNDEKECLFDVIGEAGPDARVRPNQIFAVSLPYSMLDTERARLVVYRVEAELLTPVGLRSLSPHDPEYVGTYIGSPLERDGSYHQGTVWAWLIGHFVDAYRKVHSDDPAAEGRVAEMLDPFLEHLNEAMVGQVSEIFDAVEPHAPRGAAAQAWSVAEVLRIATSLQDPKDR